MTPEAKITLFFSITAVVFSILILCMLLIKRWTLRRRIGHIARNKSVSGDRSRFHRYIGRLPELFSRSDNDVSQKIVEAGFYSTRFAPLFMPVKYALMVIGELVIFIVFLLGVMDNRMWAVISCIWFVTIVIAPDMYLAGRKKKLQQNLSGKMPYLLDLMAVCVQTGMTIEASIKYLCRELDGFDRDLSWMLNRLNDRARIVGLEQALEELQDSVTSGEISSFAMTLNQSLKYGSSVYSVLTTLAADIREVHMLSIEEKIGKLAAKMSIPLIIFIMIPIVILIAAPGVMRVFSNA